MQKHTKEIGGTTWQAIMWPTSKTLAWANRVSLLLGESAASVIVDADWSTAVRLFQTKMGDDSIADLVKELVADNVMEHVDGEPELLNAKQYEARFQGKPFLAVQVAMFVLKENCGDFFDVAHSIGEALQKRWQNVLSGVSDPVWAAASDLAKAMERSQKGIRESAEGLSSQSPPT